jgi:hypothetical protein
MRRALAKHQALKTHYTPNTKHQNGVKEKDLSF